VLRADTDRIGFGDSTFAIARQTRRWFGYEATLKRLLDVLLASLGLVASLPIWLAVVVALNGSDFEVLGGGHAAVC